MYVYFMLKMQNKSFTYKGVIVPVFSPFNNDDKKSLNLSIIPEYAKYLAAKKVSGILVNGTTGEGTSLSLDERKKVTEAWAAAVKDTKQHLMIQVGGTALCDVEELATHAEKMGADSLLCLPELYFKPKNSIELAEYLGYISLAAPKTPLLYYHIPKATFVNIDMGEFLKTDAKKIPTFSGIKFTSNDLEEGRRALENNNKYAVFLGSDTLMCSGVALGIDSFIMTSLNIIPGPALDLMDFGKGNKNLNQAQLSQKFINKTVEAITKYGSWVETMKVAMNLTTDLYMGPPRKPLKSIRKDQAIDMAKALSEIGIYVDDKVLTRLYPD